MKRRRHTVCGVGIDDYEGIVRINGKLIKPYGIWRDMIRRCYTKDNRTVRNKSYENCTVSDEWLSFSNFKKWFDENYPIHLVDKGIRIALDKDLLSKGTKIYSEETCIFIPYVVNNFMTNHKSTNTSGYVGVDFIYGKWRVRINEFDTHKSKFLGMFTDLEEAGKAYQVAREVECTKVKAYLKDLGYSDRIVNAIR